jgi:ABC-type lipoprotein export system ATPase subunit
MSAILQLRDLQKSFAAPDGERQLVIDVPELELAEREQVGLAGRSGSGKTTLLNLIAGLLTPDRGSVVVGGVDLASLSESDRDALRARELGYVYQTFNLLDGYSALENVLLGMMFGRGADRAVAEGLLAELGLGDRLHHRPNQLSIGQRQRVAVARALAGRPRLVLADEPTGSLDTHLAGEALALLRTVCERHAAALLLVSHDPEVLGTFDRTLDLRDINRAARESA